MMSPWQALVLASSDGLGVRAVQPSTLVPPPWSERASLLLPPPLRPAAAGHTSLISQVRFEPNDGRYLLTAGYDNTSRLWGGRSFRLLRTLAGHEGKVMAADISPDGAFTVASGGYDRTIKLYAPDPLADLEEAGGQ